jgi:predicted enzyme related to lactoylglutathione lyase
VITAVHTLIYSDDPEATRAFLRDVLEWQYVDAGHGWLIFKTGPSELGIHPTSGEHEGEEFSHPRQHSISLMCTDLEATIAELEAKGATLSGGIQDLGFGITTMLELPGADDVLLYEPRHPKAYDL